MLFHQAYCLKHYTANRNEVLQNLLTTTHYFFPIYRQKTIIEILKTEIINTHKFNKIIL